MPLLIFFFSFLFFLPSIVLALQQIAGTLTIQVPIGGEGSAKWGLINDGNETITLKLRSDGNISDYLSFPVTVELEPDKTTYVEIKAKIPFNYDDSERNLTGNIYAMQEGAKGGQVQINIQMKKKVTILIQEPIETASIFSLTGMFVASNILPILGATSVAIIILLYFIKIKRR